MSSGILPSHDMRHGQYSRQSINSEVVKIVHEVHNCLNELQLRFGDVVEINNFSRIIERL